MERKNSTEKLYLGLILLIGYCIYSNTWQVPFYFDDHPNILLNPGILGLRDWSYLFRDIPTRFLGYLTFAFNYKIGGASPWGYHLVNITLHLLNSLWIFFITRFLFDLPKTQKDPLPKNLLSFSAALIFLAHPLQTQAVTYIIQRITVLASFCYLSTLGLYLLFRTSGRSSFYIGSLCAAFLGLFTKEIIGTLPATLLLLEILFFRQGPQDTFRRFRTLLPFFLMILLVPGLFAWNPHNLIRNGGQMGWIPTVAKHISRNTYLATQCDVIRTYLRLLIFPAHQTFDYDFPLSRGFFSGTTFASLLLILAILMLGVRLVRRRPLASFGIFFFFLVLSVESSVIPLPDVIFEHRLYLPMAGFSFFAAFCFSRIFRSSRTFALFLVLLTLVLGTLTYRRNSVWTNPLRFWQDQTRHAPLKGRGFFHLGEVYYQKHEYLLAADCFMNAIQRTPRSQQSDFYFHNLGSAYAQLSQASKAEYWYRQGLKNYPGSGILYTALAVLKINQGDKNSAVLLLEKAMTEAPGTAIAYYERARLYATEGNYPQARIFLEKAAGCDPFLRPVYQLLFKIDALEGKIPEAVTALEKAAQVPPPDVSLYIQLGNAYSNIGRPLDAVKTFRKAIEAAPSSREGYDALIFFYAQRGDKKNALAAATEYLRHQKRWFYFRK